MNKIIAYGPFVPTVLVCMLIAYTVSSISAEELQKSEDETSPVEVSCKGKKCWVQLARALEEHPKARHIIVRKEQRGTDQVAGQEFGIYYREKWFFNSRYNTVDYRFTSFTIDGFYCKRMAYKAITSEMLLKFLARRGDETEPSTDAAFDEFAKQNGATVQKVRCPKSDSQAS